MGSLLRITALHKSSKKIVQKMLGEGHLGQQASSRWNIQLVDKDVALFSCMSMVILNCLPEKKPNIVAVVLPSDDEEMVPDIT